MELVQRLWQIPGVAAVIPVKYLSNGQVTAGDYWGYAQVMGVDPALIPYLGVNVDTGSLSIASNQIIVGPMVKDYFYDPEADPDEEFRPIQVDLQTTPLTLTAYTNDGTGTREFDLTTNGILAPGTNYDGAVIMPIQQVISISEWATGQKTDWKTFTFDQITVRTSNREVTNEVSQAIVDLGYQAGGLGSFLNEINNFFGTLRLMLGGVGGVALLVAAFGVANTMTMAILERTKEIGLMKAIGATDRDVLTVFLIEAALVGLAGGLAGVGLSYLLQNIVNNALANMPQGQQGGGVMFLPIDPAQIQGQLFVIPADLALFAVGLATVVGLGAGLFPALRAAQLPPVIALKSE
jgi:putative ABC transport system permease protein